jgi:predicted N-acyltransferase
MGREAMELEEGNGLSSLQVTLGTEEGWALGGRLGLLQRTDQQFHWCNRGYPDFDAFLAALASRKRKQLRKERARAAASGVEIRWLTGDGLRPEHWDAFWRFYQDTGARKWGRPYLTRAFFDLVHETMRDDVALVMCRRDGRWIAGALNFVGRDTLFGRYWGCVEDHPFLHFEACYYQAIEFAIAHGLAHPETRSSPGWLQNVFLGTHERLSTRRSTSPVGKVRPLCALPEDTTMKSYDISLLAHDNGFASKITCIGVHGMFA